MAIPPVSGAGPSAIGATGGAEKTSSQRFGKVLEGTAKPAGGAPSPVPVQQAQVSSARSVARAHPGTVKAAAVQGAPKATATRSAARVLDQVSAAQKRMDHILKVAESGRSFSPAELLSLQAHVYRASQELDLAGKVVEKATGGVKQILQTQL